MSNISTRKLLWLEITKMQIAVYEKNKPIVSLIIIFRTLSFPIWRLITERGWFLHSVTIAPKDSQPVFTALELN